MSFGDTVVFAAMAADAAGWCLPVLLTSFGLVLVRLLLGPTDADRAFALDSLSLHATALMALFAIMHERGLFIDVAIVIILITFLATIGFARYMIYKHRQQERS